MPGDEMHEFDTKDLKRLFGISASQVRALIRAGHIRPLKQSGRLRYSFQDLLVLRTAGALRAAKIPVQKINRTLRQIRASLPNSLPLSGLSIVALATASSCARVGRCASPTPDSMPWRWSSSSRAPIS